MRWNAFLAGLLLISLAPATTARLDPDLAENSLTLIFGVPVIKIWGTDQCIGGNELLPHVCCFGVSIPLLMTRPVYVPCLA